MNTQTEICAPGLCLSKLYSVSQIVNFAMTAYEQGLISFTQFKRIINECILAYKEHLGD